MRSPFAATLALLGGLVLVSPGARGQDASVPTPSEPSPLPSWYAQALARANAGVNVTNFWSSGSRMRAESVVAGHRIVTIVNGPWYYAYDAVGMNGIGIQRAKAALAQDRDDRRPFGNHLETLISQGAESVGTEVLMGQEVEIFRVTDGRGKRSLRVTTDAARLPMRIEIFDRQSGSTQYTDYLKWMQGVPLKDAFFEPEATVQLQRFSLEESRRFAPAVESGT